MVRRQRKIDAPQLWLSLALQLGVHARTNGTSELRSWRCE
jgi:hypothetical protein